MAARGAGSAIFRLLVVDLKHPPPLAEGDGLPDVERLLGGMNFVAGAARPSFFLVDVLPVQIHFAIAEIRQAETGLVQHHVGKVATEAQGVVFRLERGVKLRRMN